MNLLLNDYFLLQLLVRLQHLKASPHFYLLQGVDLFFVKPPLGLL